MKFKACNLYLLLFSLFLSACQFASPTKPIVSVKTANTQSESLQEKIRNKPEYQGPIKIELNPSLILPTSQAPKLKLSAREKGDFTLQSLPTGPLVFQETFFKSGEIQHPFTITNTTERYTLHVQKYSAATQVEVNINGTNWVKSGDFKDKEIEIPSLLLNSQNSLRVRISGKPGSVVIVSLVQGGEAGTLLRRRGHLRKIEETQASHVRQNDTNIFDPAEPNSLGDLSAYHKDLELTSPNGQIQRFSGIQINDGPISRFETGSLVLAFTDPVAGQNILETYYGATLTEQLDGFYKFKLNLTQSPVTEIVNLIRFVNSHSDGTVENMVFSSFDALQTMATSLDLLKRFPGLLRSIEFNELGQPTANFNDTSFTHDPNNSPDFDRTSSLDDKGDTILPFDIRDCGSNFVNSWWLQETNAFQAWDYSIGTGIKVAWLDLGYKLPYAEEFDSRRMVFGKGSFNKSGDNPSQEAKNSKIQQEKYHSLYAMLTGFAERGNGTKTAGVAPNTTLLPYNVRTSWDFANSIHEARSFGADVIGINYAWQKSNFWQSFFYEFGESAVKAFTNLSLEEQIKFSLKANIPVVISAHNFREYLGNWKILEKYSPENVNQHPLLTRDPELDDLIVVGYVQARNPGSGTASAPCPTASSVGIYAGAEYSRTGKNGAGSNFGNAMVWAPGDEIYVSSNNTPNKVARFGGTSAASPFVAATVALMRSRNPSLTPHEIQDILLNQAQGTPVVPHKDMQTAGTKPVFMLDVEKAVKAAAKSNAEKASSYFAIVEDDSTFGSGGHKLRLNKFFQTSASAWDKEKKIREQTISNSTASKLQNSYLVKVKGWSGYPSGTGKTIFVGKDGFNTSSFSIMLPESQIELLDVDLICPAYACNNPGSFTPQLSKVTYSATPVAKDGFELELEGQNLVADIRTGTNVVPIKLVFKHVKSTAPTPVTPLPGDKPVNISANQILDIRNDGTYVKLKVDPGQVSASFDYQIAFQSGITGVGNFASNYVQTGGGAARADFSVKAEGSTGGFGIQFENISTTPPPSPPPAVGVWITRDGQRKAVNPSQLIGIGIGITGLDLSSIEIVVDNKVMPIQQVAANYVSFGLTPTLAPGVKDMLIKLAGNTVTLPEAIEVLAMPPLQETQTLPTVGALQPAPFQINGEHFLAIPNYFNGQSYHLNSQIYKWNGTQFSLVQTIPTFGAYDLHPFSVGDQQFLAIANFDQNVYAANSEIYKWNGSQFVPFQTIPTTGGIDWESFSIDNRHFLALATHYNGSFERESLFYEWNGSQFVLFQSLPTRGAHKWTHFLTIGTERFLALTTYFYVGSGTEDTQSELYKWNGSQFVFNQTFNTDFDLDFDTFTIQGQLFAAIINNSRISNTVDSKILKWNGSQFVDFQNIPTTGGLNWDYFTVKGWHYLLLTTNTTLPQIYRWNGADFELYRVLAMDKAFGSALFSAGPLENYLILGSLIGPQGYGTPSRVYKFD